MVTACKSNDQNATDFFARTSRPIVVSIQSRICLVLDALWNSKLTVPLYLLLELRMRESIPPHLSTSPYHAALEPCVKYRPTRHAG